MADEAAAKKDNGLPESGLRLPDGIEEVATFLPSSFPSAIFSDGDGDVAAAALSEFTPEEPTTTSLAIVPKKEEALTIPCPPSVPTATATSPQPIPKRSGTRMKAIRLPQQGQPAQPPRPAKPPPLPPRARGGPTSTQKMLAVTVPAPPLPTSTEIKTETESESNVVPEIAPRVELEITTSAPGIPSSFPSPQRTLVLDDDAGARPKTLLMDAAAPSASSPAMIANANDIELPSVNDGLPLPSPPRRGSSLKIVLLALVLVGIGLGAGGASLLRTRSSAHVNRVESVEKSVTTPNAAPAPTTIATASPNPLPEETPTPEETPAPPPQSDLPEGMGLLKTEDAIAGRRIFVDERTVDQTPASVIVKCGPRLVKIGSAGRARTVDVPCGGEISVNW